MKLGFDEKERENPRSVKSEMDSQDDSKNSLTSMKGRATGVQSSPYGRFSQKGIIAAVLDEWTILLIEPEGERIVKALRNWTISTVLYQPSPYDNKPQREFFLKTEAGLQWINLNFDVTVEEMFKINRVVVCIYSEMRPSREHLIKVSERKPGPDDFLEQNVVLIGSNEVGAGDKMVLAEGDDEYFSFYWIENGRFHISRTRPDHVKRKKTRITLHGR